MPSTQAMDSANQDAIVKVVGTFSEMCYRIRNEHGIWRTANRKNDFVNIDWKNVFWGEPYEACNPFTYKNWCKFYKEGYEICGKLLDMSRRGTGNPPKGEFFRGQDNFSLVQQLNKAHKRTLLNQINQYNPKRKILKNLFFSGLTSLGIGASIYAWYKGQTQQIKMGSLITGLASCAGTLYCAQNIKKASGDCSWWRECTNFHELIRICQNHN